MTAEPLLPAEAALLVEPKASTAPLCLQAALLTLLGRGHVAIEEEGRLFRRRILRLSAVRSDSLPRHLATVKNTLDIYARGGRLTTSEVVRALQKSFGNDYRHYVHDVIAPSLITRALIAREQRKWLGLIPHVVYHRTANGEAKAAPLIRVVGEAGGLKKMLRNDPDGALRFARAAGVLLLLSPAARAQIPKLRKLLAERGGDAGSSYYAAAGDEEESGWQVEVEFGDLGLASGFGDLIDSIGAVGDFTGGDGGSGDGGDGGGGGD